MSDITKNYKIKILTAILFYMNIGIAHGLFAVKSDSLEMLISQAVGIEKAELLNLYSKELLSGNPAKSLELAKQSYNLSKNVDYKTEIGSISCLTEAYLRVKQYDSSDMFVEKGLLLSRENKDTLSMMEFLTNIGWAYFSKGNFHKAIASFSESLEMLRVYTENHPNSPGINVMNYAKLLNNKATVFFKMAYYDSALFYFKKSLEYRQKNNAGLEYIAPTLQNIGGVCYENKNYTGAGEYFTRAYEMFVELADTAKMASNLSNLGMTYKALGDTMIAIGNYEKALSLYQNANLVSGQINVLNNLGSVYLQKKLYKKAYQTIKQAIDLNKNERYKSALAASLQNMGSYYVKTGNYPEAINMAKKSLDLLVTLGKRSGLEDVYLLMSEAYEGMGNATEALSWYKLHKSMHDSIFNEESTANYNKLQVMLETTQREKEIALLKKEQEKQLFETKVLKTRQRVITGAAVVIILFFIVLVYNIIIRRKKDKEIHRQKELYHEKEHELAAAELEKRRIQEEELRQSVLYKSKQLSTHALHMMQKNTLLLEIQDDIKTLSKKAPSDEKTEYRRINHQINQSLRADNDWDVFKLYFEEVNRDFYAQLNEISPELTTNDHRLCALIKLNMNSKEMASVLNVAPNSIKSSRYRLKKKLGLDMEADLEGFIRNL